jgi:N-methylhydantoinase B/oxoprolinase/acetone carboxylase alpha subunit
LCAGHVPDFAIITPVFKGDRLVAWTGSICHQADMGGATRSKGVQEVFEEGLMFPPLRMFDAGRKNDTLFEILAKNVRYPDLVLGDMEAQFTANELGGRRVLDLMAEYGIDDLGDVARAVQSRSETAMRNAIRDLPDGTYGHRVEVDSIENQIFEIVCTVRIDGDSMWVDYSGTRQQADSGGINCTMVYTESHTHYGVKYLLTPNVPNNEGCFRPIKVTAPPGSIMNCTFPASVSIRTRTGWFLHDALAGALSQALPDRVRAGSGMLQTMTARAMGADGRLYHALIPIGTGQGAAVGHDGDPGWIFPSSCSGVPTETLEQNCPVIVHEKRILPDTGGAGRWRGGPGYAMTISRLVGFDGWVRLWTNPMHHIAPAQGLNGGQPGSLTRLLLNGEVLSLDSELLKTGWMTLGRDEDRLTFEGPGGGGLGNPAERDPATIEQDRRSGYIT